MKRYLVPLLAAVGITLFAQSGPPPVPVTPTTINLSWGYPPEFLTRTVTITDPTTGQPQTVTNSPTHFFIWRTFDLTNWVCVANVSMATNATAPYVNAWAYYGVQASNVTVSALSNIRGQSPVPVKPTIRALTFDW